MRIAKPKIVVLGGVVMDVRFEVEELPKWSQAVQAASCALMPGGKGLNQAIAAANLGAEVSMISAVGSDIFGSQLLDTLAEHNISTEFVRQIQGATSPLTNVLVNYNADAAFIGWKNEKDLELRAKHIDASAQAISTAQAMLVTLEVSLDAVQRAVDIAKQHDVKVIINPAPPLDAPKRISHNLLQTVDAVIPNTWEAERLLAPYGQASDEPVTPRTLATKLGQMMGPDGVACVTTARRGCVVYTQDRLQEFAAFPSNPTDTTGGSDAFCAAYAMAIVSGKGLEDAITEANAAGAMAVGKVGGAPSMPTGTDLRKFLQRQRRGNAPV